MKLKYMWKLLNSYQIVSYYYDACLWCFRRSLILFICVVVSLFNLYAVTPQKMSYQAVMRNTTGQLLVNKTVGLKISILQGSSTGTPVYEETQTATSNANGLVSLQVGGGTLVSGNFATIDWGADTYFIKTEVDPAGGTAYSITSTTQLLSVPYALYSANSGNGINSLDTPTGSSSYGGSISGNKLSLSFADATNPGILKSADWTTFNNKQNALTNPVTSSTTPATDNQLAVFNGTGVQVTPTTTLPTAAMPALTGDVTSSGASLSTTLDKIKGTTLTISSLTNGDILKYNGTNWINTQVALPASTAGAYTVFGNNTSSSAAPSYFTPSLASALFQNQGATTQVLHGNASGNPTWGAVSLTADVSGILPVANGGTGVGTFTANGVLLGNGADAVGITAAGTDGQILVGKASAAPLFATMSGDATITNAGALTIVNNAIITQKINNAAVTYAKMQNVAATSLLGNPTSSPASPGEITLGSGLTFSGTTLVNAVSGAVTGMGSVDGKAKDATNGAVINANYLYLQSADASNPGLVTTGTQTFAGAKTFTSAITAPTSLNTINGLIVNNGALSGITGLTYNSGAYNFDQSASSGTFKTGTGAVSINGDATMASGKTFYIAGSTSGTIGLKGNGAVTNYTLTLPGAVAGGTNRALLSDGSGNLSWSNFDLTSAFIQNGNSFSADAKLGTNDNYNLTFETNNTDRFTIASGTATLTGNGATTLAGGTTLDLKADIASSITIGTTQATGTITLGGTAGTGAITLGSSSGTQTVNVGTGAGASTVIIASGTTGNTVNIANGNNTVAQAINIGSGASAANNTINIGSGTNTGGVTAVTIGSLTNLANTTTIQGGNGTSAITLTPQTAGAITIGASAGTGDITLGSSSATQTVNVAIGTGAQILNLGTGGTNGKTIKIGTGAISNAITLGNSTGTTSLAFNAGTNGSAFTSTSTTTNAVSITDNALTSGALLSIGSAGTAALTNQTGLNVSLSGKNSTPAVTTYGAVISNGHEYTTSGTNVGLSVGATNGSNNYALITTGGNVGIGTSTPGSILEVNGAAVNSNSNNTSTSLTGLDFSLNNIIYTTYAGSATPSFTLTGMKNGGAYTLVATGTSYSGTPAFTHSTPSYTVKKMGTVDMTSSKTHIFSFIVINSTIYVTMATEN